MCTFATHIKRLRARVDDLAPLSWLFREAGEARFHDLRHTAATLVLSRGVNPKIVSEMLGRASIGITLDTYSHVLPTMQQSAAAEMGAVLGMG